MTGPTYIASDAYFRTPDGRWFYMNAHREPYFLDPNDGLDAETIAQLDRKAAP